MSREHFLAALLATPVLLWLIHALVLRATRLAGRPASPQGAAFLSLALGGPVLAGATWPFLAPLRGVSLAGAVAYATSVYSCLGYFYFHLFNLGETSRRLRILCALYRGPMSRQELERLYPPLSQIDIRLERLAGMGQIEEKAGLYRLKSRRLWLVAKAVEAWRGFLGFV